MLDPLIENAIYSVSSRHDSGDYTESEIGVGGCTVEGVRLVRAENGDVANPTTISDVKIEVTDGKMTLRGWDDGGCWILNWLSFQKVKDVGMFDEILIPSSTIPGGNLRWTKVSPLVL